MDANNNKISPDEGAQTSSQPSHRSEQGTLNQKPLEESYSREENRWSFDTGGCPVAASAMPFWSQSGITALLAAGFGGAFAAAFGALTGVGEFGSAINPRFLASSMIARASFMSNAMSFV